ncbi:Aste57867_16577 [Aphanomyces stellatus]|uniref:Aste57867_16577 protein n=1 Tax=Aphanomyces stellatus TaxID=120398 RepID=A0A485L6R6_9STRA|nr:hypothetical protein As57867_016520 [Aphanomyces stellatus]VFT93349.1 Aste57867_16577 [Aphanomyces stellatus]
MTPEELEERLHHVKDKEARWLALEQRIQDNILNARHLIHLNVSGMRYTIPKQTLLSIKGSYFHALLGSGHWQPDADDAYFLELHGPTFDRVMVYLHSGELSFEGLNPWETKQLRETLDYLDLSPPGEPEENTNQWTWNLAQISPGTTLSNNNMTFSAPSTTRLAPAAHYVLGSIAIHRFQLRVDRISAKTYVGFSPRQTFDATSPRNAGYFLRLDNGMACVHTGTDGWHSVLSAPHFKPGDRITVEYSQGKICFGKNDDALKVAISKLNEQLELFPVVAFYHGGQVTILE